MERKRDMWEREEQSADVEQTNLSFLSDNHQESVVARTSYFYNDIVDFHNHVVCTTPISLM